MCASTSTSEASLFTCSARNYGLHGDFIVTCMMRDHVPPTLWRVSARETPASRAEKRLVGGERKRRTRKRKRNVLAARKNGKSGSRGRDADLARGAVASGCVVATHHPWGYERGERDSLLRRWASLRVEIAGRDRGQCMGREARAILRARKDLSRGSDLTQRSRETPRSTRRSHRARPRTRPALPMISTLSPLGTALTMPCIHPAPVATMVVVGGSKVCRSAEDAAL